MRARVTITCLALVCLVVGLASTSYAQPVRNGDDVIWARDVAGADMTLDGELSEGVWQQAESIPLIWDDDFRPHPGSGQIIESGAPTNPPDPNNGIVRLLRDGNMLFLGAEVQDKSIGGQGGFFPWDGLIMNILDRTRLREDRLDESGAFTNNFFRGNRDEFFIVWRIVGDTTDADDTYANGELIGSGMPLPGAGIRLHGFYGMENVSVTEPRDPDKVAVWDAVVSVDGIVNDDTHGDDVGYTIEMRLDMAALGYDFTQAGGDKAAWNIALQDQDYTWPSNPDIQFRSRVWWQNRWGNNFNEGAAYIYGAPGVTVNGAVPEVTEPEFTIPSAELYDAPTVDGSLDEPVWQGLESSFFVQYQAPGELLDQNPEIARYDVSYFRPDINGDGNAALVVDPSVAEYKLFFKDDWLFVGVDVADQAISGTSSEGGMDGTYFFIRDRDSLTTQGSLFSRRFDVSVDSSGNARLGSDALTFSQENPDAIQAAVSLKGTSTPADASDVDEGYQIEMAINLAEVLGYPSGRGDGRAWVAMNFLDGDFLDSQNDSYATRTWVVTERAGGGTGASIYGYMDPTVQLGVGTDPVTELPLNIQLEGNYPNPFNPATTLAYALPHSGTVTVKVFDALGRSVGSMKPGIQNAGRHTVEFDASHLSSGVYFYRVDLQDAAGTDLRSTVGRMILLK